MLFCVQISYSQTYIDFISTSDSSDTWNNVIDCWNGSCYSEQTEIFKIDGDTLINSVNYSKLYIKEQYISGIITDSSCPVENIFNDYTYFGGVRENQKKIFVFVDQGPEYLAYDFNLAVGDTVPDPSNSTSLDQDRIITNIDQVLIDGINRKRFTLQSGAEIIEGIGSSNGVFHPLTQGISCSYSLNCYSEYNVTIYGDMNCTWNLGLNDENTIHDYNLYPNPSRKKVSLSGIKNKDVISVFNSQMKLILEVNSESNRELINVESWSSGIYYFQIRSNSQVMYLKFIKQ